ncbi:exopolysaccharide biosynthesis polyprenyl glycosylphosphotransferase [Pseudonocardia oroxyli]|uniref:Exopolysaccharide biosynthesis polyprenyl glycosylphosphotransferase n=1 Tax=Pseudonocardia oroxyli TaxID=366584 RepID=A0A1G7Z946_PSEOR|nr:exopolysaccharide biosynthesis polyprenyl glycosylphosphotransferase [Pseudonocardia oroxyli]
MDFVSKQPGVAEPTSEGTAVEVPVQRPAPDIQPPRADGWRPKLRRVVILTDSSIVLAGTGLAVLLGWTGAEAADRAHLVSGLLAAALLLIALPVARAWDPRMLGVGTAEFKRLGHAVVATSVILALGGLTLLVASVRIWVFLLVPVIGLAVGFGRFAVRKWLHRLRGSGRAMASVLVVGDEAAVADMVRRTRRDVHFGWRIDAACTPSGRGPAGGSHIEGVPVVGDLDSVAPIVHAKRFAVVSVGRAAGWGPGRLHRLAWELEGTDTELAVDPGLMEVAGPRMHISPVDGLPLLRLSKPRFTGAARVLKTVLDRSAAALLLLLAAPVFLAVAIAVKSDGGPVFFRQERVGAQGRMFHMVKFRSMVVDAEARRAALQAANEGAGPLFKLARDPRVTRIGALLRRYSIDELPQLLNVLNGTMSLVGPRPPLPAEVETYEDMARRKLLVRPGMTGLWQVSGRSNLSWEESVRLDLRYVENWSMAMDLTIMWKTLGAVLASRGAY